MFKQSCDRLWSQLSAISVLSIDRQTRTMTLNRRGERLYAYLCARRRRAHLDQIK